MRTLCVGEHMQTLTHILTEVRINRLFALPNWKVQITSLYERRNAQNLSMHEEHIMYSISTISRSLISIANTCVCVYIDQL